MLFIIIYDVISGNEMGGLCGSGHPAFVVFEENKKQNYKHPPFVFGLLGFRKHFIELLINK